MSLSSLAQRIQSLEDEIAELDQRIEALLVITAPELLSRFGVGPDTAAALLVSAGDNPERLHSEAAWAHLCGVAPIQASSGKTTRHRLDRGGDRQANSALWRIVMVRIAHDPETTAYFERKVKEGRSSETSSDFSSATSPARCITTSLAAEPVAVGLAHPLTVVPRADFPATRRPTVRGYTVSANAWPNKSMSSS
jgi:transposase